MVRSVYRQFFESGFTSPSYSLAGMCCESIRLPYCHGAGLRPICPGNLAYTLTI